ncbi:sugar ABC transporter permease [Salinibacterium xinjiangense]|uniref:Carbohydrate ABC transporter membrane protein 1, CUT1 family n=1 Tax=Salinibacterium xinjiangense TaxID=386302 RepID=A0A2C8YIX5_9MICO|nr:sugar ABC transporter permease [Salinibacterium xinjiangense]GGK97448.1 sugar ABC transporter permease [Salinibacterium xinjiangense]SOE50375.1 carbohydrate ABC transporter membrane protein 1, CUT1 family [Salinibacterium xinjiangense]
MKRTLTPYLFVSPAMLLLVAFGIFPILVAAVISTTDMNISGFVRPQNIKFIGLENYVTLFNDPKFWQALWNTGGFAVLGVPAIVVLSLAVALLLNRSGNGFFQTLRSFYFIPAITAIVAVSLIWGYLYNTQFGFFNYVLSLVGIPEVQWLSDPILSKFSVGFVAVWRGMGLNTIIFLAALQGVPKEYLEAASIDGAGEWRKTFMITLPLLRFAIFFVSVTTTISWLQFFDEPFVLTDGGPLGATTSVSIFLYKEGFRLNQFGYASAGSLVLFAIIAVITVIQLRLRRADDEY